MKYLSTMMLFASIVFGQSGMILGTITDNATHQPLPGVNVILDGTALGAASDMDGNFHIPGIPVGFYHVRFSAIGYKPITKLNVRVVENRPAIIQAELEQSVIEMEGVTVTREYFEKEKDALVSSRTVDLNEIRRDPAGAVDIQRMMQALPAVVSGSDQQNEIVVRGGSPGENLFIMDNIEISNPNHFGELGTGGGPINMINTLFIDRVDFLAGAFPAKYGNKASSVMDISLREGNRTMHSQDIDMSMAGIGLNVEGPIGDGRGSYMNSFKKSYLDLIIASTGLTAVPRYWSSQSKLTYDLTPTDKLTINMVYGNDAINLEGENEAWSRGAENVDVKGNQYAYGFNYKKLLGSSGLMNVMIGGTRAYFDYDVYRLNGERDKVYYADQIFIEKDTQAKVDFLWKLNPGLEISGGVDWKQLGSEVDSYVEADTIWFWEYNYAAVGDSFSVIDRSTWETNVYPVISNADPDSIYEVNGTWTYVAEFSNGSWEKVRFRKSNMFVPRNDAYTNNKSISTPRLGGYGQVKVGISTRLNAILGLRAGYLEYTDFTWLSPRLGLNYMLSPASSINLAYGRHFQEPHLTLLAMDDVNKSLRSKYNDQYVMSLEHFFSLDTRGTIEAYWKEYSDVPVRWHDTTPDSTDESYRLVNEGHAKSYGLEVFLQKKMAKDLFGTVSYSWYRAFAQDPRSVEEKYYPQTYDYQHVFSLVGGYRIPLKGTNIVPLSERNGFVRMLGTILGLGSDELEISMKYRYIGGKPYTPLHYDHTQQRWYDDFSADYNTERLKSYHRFDLMILWHSSYKNINIISYFDIQNMFNRENIWDRQYNADGTVSDILQFEVFPVGGFTLEF